MQTTILIIALIIFCLIVNHVSPEVFPSFLQDLKNVFNRRARAIMVSERQDQHYKVGGYIAAAVVFVAFWIPMLQIKGAGIIMTTLLLCFVALVFAWLREMYFRHTSEKFPDGRRSVEISWPDIRFTVYGVWHYTMFAYGLCLLVEMFVAKLI